MEKHQPHNTAPDAEEASPHCRLPPFFPQAPSKPAVGHTRSQRQQGTRPGAFHSPQLPSNFLSCLRPDPGTCCPSSPHQNKPRFMPPPGATLNRGEGTERSTCSINSPLTHTHTPTCFLISALKKKNVFFKPLLAQIFFVSMKAGLPGPSFEGLGVCRWGSFFPDPRA